MKDSQLENGLVPKDIPCPFRTKCGCAKGCPGAADQGTPNGFSCGLARAFDLITRKK